MYEILMFISHRILIVCGLKGLILGLYLFVTDFKGCNDSTTPFC